MARVVASAARVVEVESSAVAREAALEGPTEARAAWEVLAADVAVLAEHAEADEVEADAAAG